jgi:hypothetical protein
MIVTKQSHWGKEKKQFITIWLTLNRFVCSIFHIAILKTLKRPNCLTENLQVLKEIVLSENT